MALSASPTVERVRSHLCAKGLFGDVAELCEMRGDCVFVVTCPDCGHAFTLDEDDYDELLHWSRTSGESCGISQI